MIRPAIVLAIVLRGCTPALEEDVGADDADPAAGQSTTEIETDPPEPPGPPTIAAVDLGPFPQDDPRAASAAAYREAMTALEGGELETAAARLEIAVPGGFAPDLVAFRRGDVLRKLDRGAEAEAAYATVTPDSRLFLEASLARAGLAQEEGRPNGVLRLLADLPEDASASVSVRADVLRAKALRARAAEGDDAEAYRVCVRIWRTEGRDGIAAAEARACMDALESKVPAEVKPDLADRVSRAAAMASVGAKDDVIALLGPDEDALPLAEPEVACTGHYELGRARHKKRRYTDAVAPLTAAAEDCPEGETRIKAHYLLSQALARSGSKTEAIASWTSLADRYPEHSYADDGLVNAGRLYAGLGNMDEARQSFQAASDRFPAGDMVGAGMWDAAWEALRAGRTDEAIPWLELQAAGSTRGANRGRVLQGTYWLARAHLDAAEDEPSKAIALDELEAIARTEPMHWYGVISLWKLAEEDAERARSVALATRTQLDGLKDAVVEPEAFVVEQEFLDTPGTVAAIELLRGGLNDEAVVELKRALGPKPHKRWDRDTMLLASHLYELADDPYQSHYLLRLAFREEWPERTEENHALLMHAYPLAFHEPLVEVTKDYEWPSMTFQGLVREESAFSPSIKSWVGAMGLSQLMWPTAQETARKMGLRLRSRSELSDPQLNLQIGSTYFQGLFKRWGGHIPLAVASYNAGPGAVNKWKGKRGTMELDGFVETIPYKETRLYVKRVTSSWQIYHALYGDGFPYVPLRTGVVNDEVDGADPTL
ncbi:MAG: transglycosylase SLT domain-containing protein [Proteobacteria bacterium]|nr:transglycosylase SLT domain-containing protein [Pseudomonadota bacterium]